jgi:protease-4
MAKTPITSSSKKNKTNGMSNLVSSIREAISGIWTGLTPAAPILRTLGSLILLVVVPLYAGVLMAREFVPQPAVGIIYLYDDIWYGSADLVIAQINEARKDSNIKAVVLMLDSPGGTVTDTQTIYLELLSLRQEMPIVSSIDSIAASGGFYVVMATDPIFAKPSSTVGNVGVWGYIPPDLAVNEVILASGPFKLTASNEAEFLREIEGIKQEFLETVFSQRGEERIKITREKLSQGLAYPGREAVRLGLIDHLGSQNDAISFAAELAGIAHYEVIDLYYRVILEDYKKWDFLYQNLWAGAADPESGIRTLPPGAYLLYDVRLGGTP